MTNYLRASHDLHCKVVNQFFEFLILTHKVSLTVDFNEAANARVMDVSRDEALRSKSGGFFVCGG